MVLEAKEKVSAKFHLLWRVASLLSLFLAAWFFLWGFVYELIVWHKNFSEAAASSWWNWIGFFVAVGLMAFCSYLDTLVEDEEETKE